MSYGCGGCDDCAFDVKNTKSNVIGEVHITFKNRFKPNLLVIDNYDFNMKLVSTHYMTKTPIINNEDPHFILKSQIDQYQYQYQSIAEILRSKIELIPTHQLATPGSKNGYLECHYEIKNPTNIQYLAMILNICKRNNLYISQNRKKKDRLMLTFRRNWYLDFFKNYLEDYVKIQLTRIKCDIISERIEFTMYDSNQSLDDTWIKTAV